VSTQPTEIMRANLMSALIAGNCAVRVMAASGSDSIVMTGSSAGLYGFAPGGHAFRAWKHSAANARFAPGGHFQAIGGQMCL
jgi:NAD(P)-dependent dehydrogenase (short-subunit alcohol dehydrogenase family)